MPATAAAHATQGPHLGYKLQAAQHVYKSYPRLVFKGRLPPLLQGVGVMDVHIGAHGEIVAMHWVRPPSHPGARAAIERLAYQAAPYPAPLQASGASYTETWLWDKSGRFQLDSLTEGQRDR